MKSRGKGFTLIEMIAVIVVTATLFSGFVFSTVTMADFWTYQNFYQGAGLEAKLAVMRMGRDISQIQNLSGVLTANATTLSFRDPNGDTVTYNVTSGVLQRNNRTLAQGVSSLLFQYWDENHQGITTPVVSPSNTNIRRIAVTLTVGSTPYSLTARNQVVPRNLVD